ncbi:DUF3024 domain-containing protein [Sunxiuqinia sp. sy24]|uniref:DUF3024 domain-containing protein n=1 Tax=Sunxiuqinia sp. sy24 TaxID=3461495 RepID=UPI004045C531
MTNNQKTINLLEAQIEKFVEGLRPPPDMRDQLDVGFHFESNTLELFEIRPRWDQPEELMNTPFAKAKFIKSRAVWRIFWMRANGKWESYSPMPEVKDLAELFDVIEKDEYACFFG